MQELLKKHGASTKTIIANKTIDINIKIEAITKDVEKFKVNISSGRASNGQGVPDPELYFLSQVQSASAEMQGFQFLNIQARRDRYLVMGKSAARSSARAKSLGLLGIRVKRIGLNILTIL